MPNFEYLVTRLVMDRAFADQFHSDKAGALRSIQIEPTDELMKALENIDFASIGRVAEAIDPSKPRPAN